MSAPAPNFAHLTRLTDDTGLFEHARLAVVRREHGYCTDDVARGLVVTSREADPSADLLRLSECYLTFLNHAQSKTGAFHNRLGHDRRWEDPAGLGDWWGRALWGLGTAAARHRSPWIRDSALSAFRLGTSQRSAHPHAMAFAGLGAAEVLRADPGDADAAALLADAATAVGPPGADPDWPWPLPRLTYANAALAEVVIADAAARGDDAALDIGLRLLTWLRDVQTGPHGLRVVPAGGWARGEERAERDQQPIEVAALADAFATAAAVTGDTAWQADLDRTVAWFLGANDAGAVMWDESTGGGYDGLTPYGPNLNQGAESTLALLSTLQHARTAVPV
ncbi:glycosyltransferase [Catellatospora citrea]|uniref:glycosyltransferase n=1 Tax=Catellatospora citrea TaxID=53366 RepID=UPI0033C0A5CF